ncbi:MAG: nicotinate (nicotinamide) nucleotide adenylyltransferase [Phycisphaeraceae bacterium]
MTERTILIFGGTFDPPHRAHLELPEQARVALNADLILYVPAGVPPHKVGQRITDGQHRLAMLRLALADRKHAQIDTRELDAPADDPSFTVRTLEALRRDHPENTHLRLLIGSDQATVFDTWREPEQIEKLAPPAVMIRPPLTAELFLNGLAADQAKRWRRRLVEVVSIDLSATAIREAIRSGGPIPESVPARVRDYIKEHGLYRD